MRPLVSVIIPTYNANTFISDTINSIISQTYTNWELIIVDDHSTDNTFEILESFSQKHNKIFKHQLEKNSGNSKEPLIFGINKATGDYIICIGHDDILQDEYLENLVCRMLDVSPDVVLSQLVPFGSQTQIEKIPNDSFDFNQTLSGKNAFKMTIGEWKISLNGLIATKNVFQKAIQVIPKSAYINSDENLGRTILLFAQKVAFAKVSYYYRILPNSISHTISPKYYEILYTDIELNNLTSKFFCNEDSITATIANIRFERLLDFSRDFFKNNEAFNLGQKKQIIKVIKRSHCALDKRYYWRLYKHHSLYWKLAYLSLPFCFLLASSGNLTKLKEKLFL